MIKLFIQGLAEGSHPINQQLPVESIPEASEEFFGDVTIEGTLRRLGSHFSFKGTTRCMARLVCDRSLQEYNQEITANLEIDAKYGTTPSKIDGRYVDNGEKVLSVEDKFIDITQDVREELAVSLPIKRLSPEYANKDFDEAFPEYSAKLHKRLKKQKGEIDERWQALEKLRIHKTL